MSAARDEWKLVESIDELTRGTSVKSLNCDACGKDCVGTILADPKEIVGFDPTDGHLIRDIGAEVTSCTEFLQAICEDSVRRGLIYRLVLNDPPEADATPSARKLELVS